MINIHYFPEHTNCLLNKRMAETTMTQNQKGEPISLITWVERTVSSYLVVPRQCIFLQNPLTKAEVQGNREVIHYSLKAVGYGSTCLHMWGPSCGLCWAVLCPCKVNSLSCQPFPRRQWLLNLVYSMGVKRIRKSKNRYIFIETQENDIHTWGEIIMVKSTSW